jgi:hypothetical protein
MNCPFLGLTFLSVAHLGLVPEPSTLPALIREA